MSNQKIRVEIVDGQLIGRGAADEGLPEGAAAASEDAVDCYCPFCEADVVSAGKRCPQCDRPLWGCFIVDQGRMS